MKIINTLEQFIHQQVWVYKLRKAQIAIKADTDKEVKNS
jgi:hypothetical protein